MLVLALSLAPTPDAAVGASTGGAASSSAAALPASSTPMTALVIVECCLGPNNRCSDSRHCFASPVTVEMHSSSRISAAVLS